MLLFQAYAYYRALPLSLGPFVILDPWLIQAGLLPYEHLPDEHTPLMPFAISALRPFVPDGLHLATLVLVSLVTLSACLVFLVGKRDAGALGALGAAAFFVCWSYRFGFGKLWHETCLTPLYLALFLLHRPSTAKRSPKRLALVGLVLGTALAVKQQAGAVVVGYLLWHIVTRRSARQPWREVARDVALICAIACVPLAAYTGYHYWRTENLDSLLFWTIRFNLTSRFAVLGALLPTRAQLGALAPAYLGLPAALLYRSWVLRKGDPASETNGCAWVLLITSSLGAYPRFGAFHLQPSLPFLAWLSVTPLAGVLATDTRAGAPRVRLAVVAKGTGLALAACSLVAAFASYGPVWHPETVRKIWEYSDLPPLATEVRRSIPATDCPYIFPDDEATSNLYYLLRCFPSSFVTYGYPWYMIEPVRSKLLDSLERRPPKWILYTPGRWAIDWNAPEVVRYILDHYRFERELRWAQGSIQLLRSRRTGPEPGSAPVPAPPAPPAHASPSAESRPVR